MNKVYELLLKIPKGKVTTYKALAKAIGKPNNARVIGKILNNNPNPIIVPCHRVIRSNGMLGGYAYGINIKRILLELEGVKIKDYKVNDECIIKDLTQLSC